MNIFKKFAVFATAILVSITLIADTVNLTWTASPDTNVVGYSVFAVKGSNAVFTDGNSNAVYIVSVTNQLTASITNVPAGWWTFTANAFDSASNTSANCTNITAYVPLAPSSGLRVINITIP